jgi:hypothetical protein
MMSRGLVSAAARRRIGTESESMATSRVDMDLNGLKRMEEFEARRKISVAIW